MAFFEQAAGVTPIDQFPVADEGVACPTYGYPLIGISGGIVTGIGTVVEVYFFAKTIDKPGPARNGWTQITLGICWQISFFTIGFDQRILWEKNLGRAAEKELLYTSTCIAKLVFYRKSADDSFGIVGVAVRKIKDRVAKSDRGSTAVVLHHWSSHEVAESRVNGFDIVKNGVKIGADQSGSFVRWTGKNLWPGDVLQNDVHVARNDVGGRFETNKTGDGFAYITGRNWIGHQGSVVVQNYFEVIITIKLVDH